MAKDLVCGMEIKEEEAAASSLYEGKKYYFCTKGCKQKFDENPEEYIKSEESEEVEKDEKTMPEEDESKHEPGLSDVSKEERIDLPIVGMSCASCATTIQRSLADLKGVEKANVNFATSKATVLFQPQLVKPESILPPLRLLSYFSPN
jgi:Cu+-exporting ATPase